MKTPITLTLDFIPQVIIGTFEVDEKFEQAIIAGDLIFAPSYRITPDGVKELKTISLIPKERQVKEEGL